MMIAERIQMLIHKLEVDSGARRLNYLALTLAVVGLAVWYDTHDYRNFASPEAMDAAQVARNLAEGHGFTTEFVRPFSVYLIQKHNHAAHPGEILSTNAVDFAQIKGLHPDLANAPVYPLVLAGLMKLQTPEWKVQMHKPFWSDGGRFMRYPPEFHIAIFNQLLLLVVVLLTFLVAKKIFDTPAAWLAALLTLGSDVLWKFSVSGLPTLLLMVIFLGLVWCLVTVEELGRVENPNLRRLFFLALTTGLLAGLGMLTRYSFGWVLVPVAIYLTLFGGTRRTGLAVAAFLAFAVVVTPWIARNLAVSGTFFGTAGYAVVEGTFAFPDTRLMQSLNPDLTSAYWVMPYKVKLQENLRYILQNDMLRLGGGWLGVLFLAGLLLGLRNVVARRLRYFTMMCLGVFIIVSALGRTQWTYISPEMNSENPLVLLTPLVVIFGVAFFLTLLNQMNVPSLQVRYSVIGLVVVLACEQFIMTLLPPRISPIVYPPYYPPEIQKISGWMRPDELVMSDIPWAVAWYGDRQCTWTTINSQYEFFAFNDYVKPVRALYLTLNTLDAKLFTECLQGGVDSWGNFVLKTVAANQIPPQFPLKTAPYGLLSGLVLTDRQRWETE
jgi:hypothetical protein